MKDLIPEDSNPVCVGPGSDKAGIATSCKGCPNAKVCAKAPRDERALVRKKIKDNLEDIPYKLLILSGKGGVGKSTVTSQLAFQLASKSFKVGVLDLDICGPSIPRMFGVSDAKVSRSNIAGGSWLPVYSPVDNISIMSVGFLLESTNSAVIWRGPRKTALIAQFLSDVYWGDLDVLLIDCPPGTSDEHISIVSLLNELNKETQTITSILVTTPQNISFDDVRKEVDFCRKTNLDILGMVENCKYIKCGTCNTKEDMFSGCGVENWCNDNSIDYIAGLEFCRSINNDAENGVKNSNDSIVEFGNKVYSLLNKKNKNR